MRLSQAKAAIINEEPNKLRDEYHEVYGWFSDPGTSTALRIHDLTQAQAAGEQQDANQESPGTTRS